MEGSDLSCLVCNAKLEVTSCVNIFYTSLPRNGTQLGSFILQVLRCLESDLRSSYVCSQCCNLFQMLEQAQWTATNIRTEIIKVYESSNKKKEVRLSGPDDAELLAIDDKCFLAQNLGHDDKFKVSDLGNQTKLTTAECSTIQNKESLISQKKNEVNDCMPKHQDPTLSSNFQDAIPRRKFQVKDEKSNYGDCDDASSSNIVSDEMLNETEQMLKEENVNEIKLRLNRQEKMALYIHQCRVCGRLFKDENDLHSHSLKHGGSLPYKCRICEERFVSLATANIHAAQLHPKAKDPINVATEPRDGEIAEFINDCSGIFPQALLGMSDNEEQDDFEWKEAVRDDGKGNDTKDNISRTETLQTIEGSKEVTKKTKCNKSSGISKYSLKPLKHACTTCGKKWRTSAELKTHVKSHSNLRPYMCEKCGQAYKHKHALEIHVGMHNGINPFQCSFCNKCFTQKGALMRHLPMHTGETPYQCELCGKRFVHHTSYNMHALSHTGKKSYQCHVCDLSLLSTSHLKRHMRVHTGEKPYSCTLCGKRFAERYNLFAHQKIHDPAEILAKETKKIQYKCKQCAILFDKKHKLDDHLRQHHSAVTDSTTNRKWVGDMNEVENPMTKFFVSQNQRQNQNGMKPEEIRDNITIDQSWQQVAYSKLQSIDNDPKLNQTQNTFQIATNPLTVTLENHKMLIDMSCNRNLISNMGLPSGN